MDLKTEELGRYPGFDPYQTHTESSESGRLCVGACVRKCVSGLCDLVNERNLIPECMICCAVFAE